MPQFFIIRLFGVQHMSEGGEYQNYPPQKLDLHISGWISKQLKYCLLTGKLWIETIILGNYYLWNHHFFSLLQKYMCCLNCNLCTLPIYYTRLHTRQGAHKPAWVSSSLCSHLMKCICVSTLCSYLCLCIYVISLLYVRSWYFVHKSYTVCRVSGCLVVEMVLTMTSSGTQRILCHGKFS